MKPLDPVEDPPVLGPFELLGVVGEGGMGKAYLARRLPLEGMTDQMAAAYFLTERDEAEENDLAVVKVISPAFLGRGDGIDRAEKRARFSREISAVQAVVSDRVPAFRGAAPDAARPWLAVDYVHGPDLDRLVRRHTTLAIGPYAALGLALVDALRAIHGAGLLHRDLKPGNVILGPSGPVVLDFGLAVALERSLGQALTQSNVGFGTRAYMPLEQEQDIKRVGEPADVYALGATLFFAATGRPPYTRGPSTLSPSWHGVDPEFRPLLARIITHHAQQRPSLDDVHQGLVELLVANSLTEEQAEEQLRDVVADAGLTPVLPPQAAEGRVNPEVRDRAQAALDAGGPPDGGPGHATDDALFQELLGPPQDPEAEPAESAPAPVPEPRRSGGPEPGEPAPAPAPPGALKVAEKLRKAYARQDRL